MTSYADGSGSIGADSTVKNGNDYSAKGTYTWSYYVPDRAIARTTASKSVEKISARARLRDEDDIVDDNTDVRTHDKTAYDTASTSTSVISISSAYTEHVIKDSQFGDWHVEFVKFF